jgi:hypothetical protein
LIDERNLMKEIGNKIGWQRNRLKARLRKEKIQFNLPVNNPKDS